VFQNHFDQAKSEILGETIKGIETCKSVPFIEDHESEEEEKEMKHLKPRNRRKGTDVSEPKSASNKLFNKLAIKLRKKRTNQTDELSINSQK
jgi:hypothetical protein